MVNLDRKDDTDGKESNGRQKRLKTGGNNDEDISFFSMRKKFTQSRSENSISTEHHLSGVKISDHRIDTGPDLDLTDDDEDADSDKNEDKKPEKSSITEYDSDNKSIDEHDEHESEDEIIIPTKTEDVKPIISDIESVSSFEDENDNENHTELNPELLQRIKEREEQLLAEKNDSSFAVGLVFRSKFPHFENQTVVTKIQSTDTFKTARKKYIQELKKKKAFKGPTKYMEEILEMDAIFIWKSIKIFDFATPNLLHVKRTAPSMVIEVMSEEQFEQVQREAEEKTLEEGRDHVIEEEGEEIVEEQVNDIDQEQTEQDNYFRVSMKGKDNIPVDVKVNSGTQISKLVEFYRSQRNLTANDKIRLEFDDEPLNDMMTVGDTELEEDFTIDVYINS